jgi:hypothetical protein
VSSPTMFQEYEAVRLLEGLPEEGLEKGITGTVLMILDPVTPVQHYIVEFMDGNGNSLGVPIVPETLLERCAE